MSVIGSDGLVIPRKLRNPCIESPAKREINQQIKWNAKAGVNVLTKTELERALDRQRRLQVEKERAGQKVEEETPFDKALKERARRLEQLEAGGYTDTSRDPSPEPSSQSVAIKSNMFKPAAPSRSPETRLSSSNLNLSGSHRSPPQDGSAAVVRSKSPATLGFGNNNKATHLTPTFINNNNTRMDKDLETRLRGVKLNQNGSDDGLKQISPRHNSTRAINSNTMSPRAINSCGNSSSGTSSKSSSPEPELLKVFAQIRKDDHEFS